jgi:hypothetical protein
MTTTHALPTITAPVPRARTGGWQHWAPYAAVAWSLLYGALGLYWALSGRGFPYAASAAANPVGPLLGRLGPTVAWVIVLLAGIPAAAMGAAMLRNMKGALPRIASLRRAFFIAGGAALAAMLLLFTTDLILLESLGYVPFTLFRFLTGADTSYYLRLLAGSGVERQLFCLVGGFLWLGATVSYARRSSDACLYCGRGDDAQGWQSPESAARWGRIAVYVAMAAPLLYAFTRYAWALGWPLGMTRAYWQAGQEQGLWVSGLFLATFGIVGALLMLGLVQRWGEIFPRWMIGLAGRRVPIALAVVPAALVSVVVFVGGIAIWSATPQMAANVTSTGAAQSELIGALIFQLGPTLLFPVWGIALAVAALGYYFRRRGPCAVCGRGT